MNILFLSLVDFGSIEEHNIYTDLLRTFYREGHTVCVVSPVERRKKQSTRVLQENERVRILKLKTGNIQKTNLIEKGISTITIEKKFIQGIKRYFSDIKFDLVLYSTPPITLQKAVNYVKKRDGAVTYLMLKDIFPQNAVDMGMMTKTGVKSVLYRYFRRKEIRLYRDSDYIGCMSPANVEYIKEHNPEIPEEKVEVCPNCMEPTNLQLTDDERIRIRKDYNIPEDAVVFVYGGNLGRPQGIPFMLRCIEKSVEIENVYFLIVGSGTEYEKIDTFIKDKQYKNVQLIQYLPREQYERVVRSCDVGLIFLDYRFTIPNFPSRLLAYMDAGLPILAATDVNTDIGRIIEGARMGVWCESTDSLKFTEKVRVLCENTNLRKLQGIRGMQFLLEQYSVEQLSVAIMKHLQ